MKTKVFTVEEANQTLPLVKKIVKDIVDGRRELDSARARYEEIRAGLSGVPTPEEGLRMRDLEDAAEQVREKIESCIEELGMIGCQLKDLELGLIDFPAQLEGRPVLLCWRLGEEKVNHWHSLDGGYAGREPLPD